MFLKNLVQNFVRDRSGATAIEYALLVSLLVLGTLAALAILSDRLSTSLSMSGQAISSAVLEDSSGGNAGGGTGSGGGDSAAPTPTAPSPDFVVSTNIPFYFSSEYQNWFNRPSGISSSDWNEQFFTISGDGNPRALTHTDEYATSGSMRWNGISLQFDTPSAGQTAVIDLEISGHLVRFEFTRDTSP